jgi:ATP-binding protein involved in chromosome partitioning
LTKPPALTSEAVLAALRGVVCPGITKDIVTIRLIGDIAVENGRVSVAVVHTSEKPQLIAEVRALVEQQVRSLPGAREVVVTVTGPGAEAARGHDHGHEHDHAHGHGHGARPAAAGPDPWADRAALPGVRHICLVASAKGGVGKSSVAVNLALALQELGHRTGLLDADIYGPSIPAMLSTREVPLVEGEEETIIPIRAHGLQVMSIGLLVPPEKAMIWRGPMVFSAVRKFLKDVRWDNLDWLVVDMPPGTGDAQLTLVQQVPVDGVVIVTTPQEIALADVRRGIQMFREVDVPVFGVVENMSHFVCPHCGERSDIFGQGGGERTAAEFGVPFLGGIPIDPTIRVGGDEGRPAMTDPTSPTRAAFLAVARRIGGD